MPARWSWTARGREKLSGNLLLDCLLGASLVYTDGWSTSAVIEETLAALQAAGRAPYFIPEGGSNAVGSAGYLAMVPELLAQADSLPVPPARLVCTMGSLGTFAGLWLGARAFGAPFSVTGVAVNPTTGYTREKAAALVNEMSAAYGLDIAAAPEDIDIIYADAAHDYAGPGYNVPDAKTRGRGAAGPHGRHFSGPVLYGQVLPGLLRYCAGAGRRSHICTYGRHARSVDAGASGRFCGGLLELNQTRQSHNHQLSWWLEQAL
ncbi:MAG: pyridoxal-phosphate dependent enzyme [Ruthenibacterium lactatiformans]